MPEKNVEELLARSASTDVQVLLTAKENAKRAALDDPSQANLAALDRASRMLESAMQATTNLRDWKKTGASSAKPRCSRTSKKGG